MSEMANDSDSSCEWEMIADGATIPSVVGSSLPFETFQGEEGTDAHDIVSCISSNLDGIDQPEELWCRSMEIDGESREEPVIDDVGESDTSSDIEKIDEPSFAQLMEESYSPSMICSAINPLSGSQGTASEFSTCGDNNLEGCHYENVLSRRSKEGSVVSEDFSDWIGKSCDEDFPQDMNIAKLRSYKHTPNRQLDIFLNFLVASSLVLVIGLGIGHIIGWSIHWLSQSRIEQNQISQLKMIRDQFIKCLQKNQHYSLNGWVTPAQALRAKDCIDQLDKLFANKNNLMAAFANIDKAFQCKDNNLQQQKSNVLLAQLQQIETIKQVELLKSEEKKFRQKLKDLEEENNDLKIKLENEMKGDLEDEKIMFLLMKENAKLKMAMESLDGNSHQDFKSTVAENLNVAMGSLKEQINQLKIENKDLRRTIVRFRYVPLPGSKIPAEIQNNINKLKTENMDLKLEIGKMRYTKPPDEMIPKENHQDVFQHSSDFFNENYDDNPVETKEEVDPQLVESGIPKIKHDKNKDSNSKDLKNSYMYNWPLPDFFELNFDSALRLGKKNTEKIMDQTKDGYSKDKSKFISDETWNAYNKNANNILQLLKVKWEEIRNMTLFRNPSSEEKQSFMKGVTQIWRDTKQKCKSLVKSSKIKAGKKVLKKVLNKFENVVNMFKSTWYRIVEKKGREADCKNDDANKLLLMHPTNLNKENKSVVSSAGTTGKLKQKHKKMPCMPKDSWNKNGEEMKVDWVFERAQYREHMKQKAQEAEWVFGRARSRNEQRNLFNTDKENFNKKKKVDGYSFW